MNPDDEIPDSRDGSVADDEPLIPDEIDDEFYSELSGQIHELIRYTRNKLDNQINADNIQRMQMVCNKFKSDFHHEEMKCSELTEQVENYKKKLDDTVVLSQLDQDTNRELKGVIESAWRQKDAAQGREQAIQEEVIKLRDQVEHFELKIQQLNERRTGSAFNDSGRGKDGENKEIEKLKHSVAEANKKLQIQRLYTSEVEQLCSTLEDKNKGLILMLEETSSEGFRDKKKLDACLKELDGVKSNEERTDDKLKKLQTKNEHLLKHHIHHNLQMLAVKTNLSQLHTLQNATNNKLTKLTTDFEYLTEERDKLKMDLTQKTNLLKAKEEEFYKLKQDNSKVRRSQDGLNRKLGLIKRSKEKVDTEITRLRNQVNTLEKELNGEQKSVEKLQKDIDLAIRERDQLKRELITIKTSAEKCEENLQLAEQENKLLNDMVKDNNQEKKKFHEDLMKAKQETKKKFEIIEDLTEKLNLMDTDNHYKDNLIDEYKQDINEIQLKLTKLQGLLDLTRNERNSCQRKLQHMTTERDSIKEKLQTSKEQFTEQNEKFNQKTAEISKLQIQIEKLEKDRTVLKMESKNTQVIYQHSRSELIEKRLENDKLYKLLQDEEQKLAKSQKQYENCIHDKNLVDSNLMKTTANMEQLKDRLELTQNSLDNMEKSLGESLDNIRLMKIEIKNLRTEREVLKRDRECSADLRTELLHMHRVLNQERIKARALQDEMLTPMNVHRWRTLGGRDPEKMDLVKKIQILQRQVLLQNVSTIDHQKALEESHKLYTALKQFMIKLPSYKVKEQLNEMKHNLTLKNKKLKALTAELETKTIDDKSKEEIVDELRNNLTSAKKELTKEKKTKIKLLEEREIYAQMQMQCFSAPQIGSSRILGAGFKMPYGNSFFA